jgi:ankyrin repeat protein
VGAGADLALRQHYGWTPLLRAVVEGTPAEVEALLAAGANPNDALPYDTLPAFNAGRTALMAAVPNCHGEAIVELLLRAGADPRARDANGATFFDYVAETLGECPEGAFAESVRRCLEVARRYDGGAGT